jgi:hypothetical protein
MDPISLLSLLTLLTKVPTIKLRDVLGVLPLDSGINYGLIKTDLQGTMHCYKTSVIPTLFVTFL